MRVGETETRVEKVFSHQRNTLPPFDGSIDEPRERRDMYRTHLHPVPGGTSGREIRCLQRSVSVDFREVLEPRKIQSRYQSVQKVYSSISLCFVRRLNHRCLKKFVCELRIYVYSPKTFVNTSDPGRLFPLNTKEVRGPIHDPSRCGFRPESEVETRHDPTCRSLPLHRRKLKGQEEQYIEGKFSKQNFTTTTFFIIPL